MSEKRRFTTSTLKTIDGQWRSDCESEHLSHKTHAAKSQMVGSSTAFLAVVQQHDARTDGRIAITKFANEQHRERAVPARGNQSDGVAVHGVVAHLSSSVLDF